MLAPSTIRPAETLYLARVVLLGFDAGEAGGLLAAMTALAGDHANVSTFQAGLCLTAAFAGELGLAKRLLSDQADSGFGNVSADVEGLAVVAFYAHAAAIIEDRSSAPVLLSLLETVKPKAVRVGALTGWWGPVDFHIGALYRLLGRFDEAKRRLESSLAIASQMRSTPFITRSKVELAALPH